MSEEVTDVTVLKLTVSWHGDYYDSSERASMLSHWLVDALEDRDDCPQVVSVEELQGEK